MRTQINQIDYIDYGMRAIAETIKNDYTLSEEEKETALAEAMDKVGVKEYNGHYYIPTGVWDDEE